MLRTRVFTHREIRGRSSVWCWGRLHGRVYVSIARGRAGGGRACRLIGWSTTSMSIVLAGRPGMADLYTRTEANMAIS